MRHPQCCLGFGSAALTQPKANGGGLNMRYVFGNNNETVIERCLLNVLRDGFDMYLKYLNKKPGYCRV
jgi:hypothetical protein